MTTLALPIRARATGWAALKDAAIARGSRKLSLGTLLTAEVAAGATVQCAEGCVWITSDVSTEDVILEAGDARTFRWCSRILIEALEDSRIRLDGVA